MLNLSGAEPRRGETKMCAAHAPTGLVVHVGVAHWHHCKFKKRASSTPFTSLSLKHLHAGLCRMGDAEHTFFHRMDAHLSSESTLFSDSMPSAVSGCKSTQLPVII